MEKTRVRVKAGSRPAGEAVGVPAVRPRASYLRDNRSGIIAARPAYLREHRDDVRRVWDRAGALAMDMIQNSGRLKGACDQIIADTVGVELALNPQPNLAKLGYSDTERRDFIAIVKAGWKTWAWKPSECDVRGKLTIPQMADVGLRYWLAFGESTAIADYMGPALRRRYGIRTGNKMLMSPPHRLVRDTNEFEGLVQGVIHDENGRAVAYRFRERRAGIETKVDYRARDAQGRDLVLHVFEPHCASDVRGLSPMVPGMRKHLMADGLDDATAQMAFLQTILGITLTSDAPSADAFEGLEAIQEIAGKGSSDIASDFIDYFGAQLDRAADSKINVSSDPQVSHLAPGEKLDIKTAAVPGSDYLPFAKSLARDMARALGITYGGLTMDHQDATYSSVRMETSSIWPVVMRRRERIAAPHYQMPYEHWLEEEIETGRIPFKGGIEAFRANRDDVLWANWQGPAQPTADDKKSAEASSERLINGTSSLAIECSQLGHDPDELFEQRQAEHQRYVKAGMTSPYDRKKASDPATKQPSDSNAKAGA
ncbi:phage portal protein, lambda family [Hartmannibacter diazotrophicus]|uniref:Phage portal protein, lambda family n=1 Tax=Hartmannibacter diazotrophicus TaxID=1482074 RepID=A0A2C9D5Q6_9HYPH|nr:phage portal protein [Hartmannibacter diazotrophicus]SON55520.1 phage portal protein, lambda family [Hartmannibacter diazotrophicus]